MKKVCVLAVSVACSSAPPSPHAKQPVATASARVATAPVATVSVEAPPAPADTNTWITRPPKDGTLFVAVDGLCRYLSIFPADGAVLFGYGDPGHIGPEHMRTIARLTSDGVADMSKGLVSPYWGAVESAAGRYPDALMLVEWGGGRTTPSDRVWLWNDSTSAWSVLFANDGQAVVGYESPAPWRDGSIVALARHQRRDDQPDGTYTTTEWSTLASARLPPNDRLPNLLPKDFSASSLLAFPTGELYVVGSAPPMKDCVVRWSDGGTVREQVLGPLTGMGGASVSGSSPADVRVRYADTVLAFAGGRWVPAHDAPPATGLPANATIRTRAGDAWAIGAGEVFHWKSGAWAPVALPAPVYSIGAKLRADDLEIADDGEVVIGASYLEKGVDWKEPIKYRALLRSHRPNETMRCNEPNPEDFTVISGNGFQSWPPMADASCKTPFAVLLRESKRATSPTTYPRLRETLRARPALRGVSLVEFVSGDRVFVGAKATDYAQARSIVDAAAARLDLRPEIVCGEPTPRRIIPVE